MNTIPETHFASVLDDQTIDFIVKNNPEGAKQIVDFCEALEKKYQKIIASDMHGDEMIYVLEDFFEDYMPFELSDEMEQFVISKKNELIEKIKNNRSFYGAAYLGRKVKKRTQQFFKK